MICSLKSQIQAINVDYWNADLFMTKMIYEGLSILYHLHSYNDGVKWFTACYIFTHTAHSLHCVYVQNPAERLKYFYTNMTVLVSSLIVL